MMLPRLLLLLLLGIPASIVAQNISDQDRKALIAEIKRELLDSLRKEKLENIENNKEARLRPWKGDLELSTYVEAYYIFDIINPRTGARPSFIYSYNRHNEVNINLAILKLNYNAERVRANVALMAGTYSNAALSTEAGVLKNIYEVNAGINLSRSKQLWLDVGIFPSHIGFEGAIGKDNWNLSRSILADNSPYYETGAKLTYSTDDGKVSASALVLNGWGNIQGITGNSLPSFGWQVLVKPIDRILINSSSYIGPEGADVRRQMRYFHNFYLNYAATVKLGFTLGFDIGGQQKQKDSSTYYIWYSPIIIARYAPIEKLAISARVEYYTDPHNVIIRYYAPNIGVKLIGYSVNIDVLPFRDFMVRFESRLLQSTDNNIFPKKSGTLIKLDPTIGFSISYAFAHKFH